MEITKYKYSFGRMLLSGLLFPCMTVLFYMIVINEDSDYRAWLVFGFVLSVVWGRFIYLASMYHIPCLQGKTALALDTDKLQLFIKGKLLLQDVRDVAYWKDIDNIAYISLRKGSPVISLTMKDGNDFAFRTKYIAGNDKEIYNTIMAFFNSALPQV
jgi:hypothetical protein